MDKRAHQGRCHKKRQSKLYNDKRQDTYVGVMMAGGQRVKDYEINDVNRPMWKLLIRWCNKIKKFTE